MTIQAPLPLFFLQPVKLTDRQSVKNEYHSVLDEQKSGIRGQSITVDDWTHQQQTKQFHVQCALVEQHRFEECLQEISCALYLEGVFHRD
jgi:hypothetical protein